MIIFANTRIHRSEELPIAVGASIGATGLGLVATASGAVGLPSGANTEAFAGFSLAVNMDMTDAPRIDEIVAVGSAVALVAAPIAGTLRVVDLDDGQVLTAGDPATTATAYSVSGTTITVHSTRANHQFRVASRVLLDIIQSRALQGDEPAGGIPNRTTGTIGVMRAGVLFTTEFDTTIDWSAVQPATVKLAVTTGRVTSGGSGPAVPNFQIRQVPASGSLTAGTNALGFYFSA